ncbi:MAG: LemA family protein [Provencibacterium sp.]|jgi:LemA protein|nr:LemA family protein [Provencibacterium sp.]
MKKTSKGLIILMVAIGLAVLLAITAFGSYNSLVGLHEGVESSQADIQTQLQRRSDLIPNLVNTVKGYAAHEEEVFSAIADARAQLAGAGSIADLAQADSSLTSALNRLLVIAENYPELKADAQYTALMDELAGTENRIAVARRGYNEEARVYNEKIRSFPTVLVAGMMGFERADYFEASSQAQAAPQVDFGV